MNSDRFKGFAEENLSFQSSSSFSVNSKNKNFYKKKGVNCNKPLKRDREQQLRGANLDSPVNSDDQEEQAGKSNKMQKKFIEKAPAHLRGKALGLWYRDRNRERQQKAVPINIGSENQRVIEQVLLASKPTVQVKDFKYNLFKENFFDKINTSLEEKLDLIKIDQLSADETLDEMLYQDLMKKNEHNKQYQKILEFRKTLPSYKFRKEIIELIKQNQIIIISGETGCGKTTQLVQYVLDDYILNKQGSLCNVVCTQPRRISAISVAERVAFERDEKLGESVGYVIRLENEAPERRRGTVTFVTTGILIQWLQFNPSLNGITHLFLDEIHERNILCDFLITLMKYIMPKRPDLRVILMSATLNEEKFSEYFGGIPSLTIPGFTYPVQDFYLEDVLEKTKYRFSDQRYNFNFKKPKAGDAVFNNFILPYVNNLERTGTYSKAVISQLRNPASEKIDINLIVELVMHICRNEDQGAILIFVPGLSQIQDVNKALLSNKFFSSSQHLIIPVHSILPTVSQKEVFCKPPPGVRKIVIATPIAETSITIDDVVYVIDTGKHKTSIFDMEKNVQSLEPEWETLANAKQRRGRAGRTKPGKCYKLFTKAREETFEPFITPEMQRTRLEVVILNAKTLQLGKIHPFLEKVMDPPDPKAVTLSVNMLRTLNALDNDEKLTPLGYHLAKLPMDPQTGKMILMGALFSCLDPILSIVSCLNFKDPFIFKLGEEHRIQEKRLYFSRNEKSDHYMLSEAFREWEEADKNGQGFNFAYANYLSHHNLILLRNLKKQFANFLLNMNFVVSSDPKHPKSNFNSHNASLIKAIVCSGLYPNVAMLKKIVKNKSESHLKVILKTVDHPRVTLHDKSVLDNASNFESPFFVYYEKLKSSSIFLFDATMIHPMALLLFGEKCDIVQENKDYAIRVDKLIKFSSYKKTAVLVQNLRKQLLDILELSISNPRAVDWEQESQTTLILRAIVELVTSEDKTSFDNVLESDLPNEYGKDYFSNS